MLDEVPLEPLLEDSLDELAELELVLVLEDSELSEISGSEDVPKEPLPSSMVVHATREATIPKRTRNL